MSKFDFEREAALDGWLPDSGWMWMSDFLLAILFNLRGKNDHAGTIGCSYDPHRPDLCQHGQPISINLPENNSSYKLNKSAKRHFI